MLLIGCSEEDLRDSLEKAMNEHPDTCAVLVRRHGVYEPPRIYPGVAWTDGI